MAGTGRPKTGGRQKGVRNKITRDAKEAMEGKDPLMKLWELGLRADQDDEKAVAATCYKEICKYIYPQLKAVEHQHDVSGKAVFEINMIGIDPGGE